MSNDTGGKFCLNFYVTKRKFKVNMKLLFCCTPLKCDDNMKTTNSEYAANLGVVIKQPSTGILNFVILSGGFVNRLVLYVD